MKIILRQDVKNIGTAGEIKNVADGFARNYLLPKGLVLQASDENLRRWENEKKGLEKKKKLALKKAREYAAELEKVSCTITAKTGEDNKMFGSVTAAHIAESLQEAGHTIDKKNIVLEEPIKEPGAYVIDVKVASGVLAKVKVWVVGQQ